MKDYVQGKNSENEKGVMDRIEKGRFEPMNATREEREGIRL